MTRAQALARQTEDLRGDGMGGADHRFASPRETSHPIWKLSSTDKRIKSDAIHAPQEIGTVIQDKCAPMQPYFI